MHFEAGLLCECGGMLCQPLPRLIIRLILLSNVADSNAPYSIMVVQRLTFSVIFYLFI